MNSHFNRQFILIDFRLLEDRQFLKFLGSSEFATYLVLRRNIWRSTQPHYMGLERRYEDAHELVCSLTREKIAQTIGIAEDNISRHLSALERKEVIRRKRTGRQNIYVLGEWLDVKGNGSHRVEWFYMEAVFGMSKDDLMQSVRSDPTAPSGQNCRRPSDNNRIKNREEKSVNGVFQQLPDLDHPSDKIEYLADTLVTALDDEHSRRFYRLVAAKLPEAIIRRALAEIKADGAQHPARLFTYKMQQAALAQRKAHIGKASP